MKSFTKVEIGWAADALKKASEQLEAEMMACLTGPERTLLKMRSEQLASISMRLNEAVKQGNKRIEIKY